jgi:hypothetical protein
MDVSVEVAAAPAIPAGGWDLFSDSSDEDGEGEVTASEAAPAPGQGNASAAAAMVAQVLRACPRRVAEPSIALPGLGSTGQAKLLLPASVLLVGGVPAELEAMRERLAAAGAVVQVRPGGDGGSNDGDDVAAADCIVLLCDGRFTAGRDGLCLRWLLPGGTLLLRLPADNSEAVMMECCPARLWLTAHPPTPVGSSCQLLCLRRVAVVANTTMSGDHIHYATKAHARERELLEACTVARTAAERQHGTLSEAGFKKASASLREQGLCVVRGLLDPATVAAKADAAVAAALAAEADDAGSFNVNADKFTVTRSLPFAHCLLVFPDDILVNNLCR